MRRWFSFLFALLATSAFAYAPAPKAILNGVALTNQPKVIASTFDPLVEFLELGINVSGKARWKVYGPDLDGRYGGMNGTGGLDGYTDLDVPNLSIYLSCT